MLHFPFIVFFMNEWKQIQHPAAQNPLHSGLWKVLSTYP